MDVAGPGRLRRRQVPDRIVGDRVVLARPDVDEAVVLGGAAAAAWIELDEWTTVTEVESAMAGALPELGAEQRASLLAGALAMLAYDMNGAPLSFGHGAPLRLRNEVQLGFKQVKWIKGIEFVAHYSEVGSGFGGYRNDMLARCINATD